MLGYKGFCGWMAAAALLLVLPERIVADKPAELQQKVDELIEDLDADSRAVRARAERRLLELGPEILPHLPPPELIANVASRESVRRIRVELERREALASVLPSRVTVTGTFSLNQLLQAVSEQTGNAIDIADVPAELLAQQFDVDYQEQTFWAVMDDLVQRGQLRYRFDVSAQGLKLEGRPDDWRNDEVAVTHSRAFRLAITSATLRPLFGDEDSQLLRIRFSVAAEPRLRPLFLRYSAKTFLAKSPSGHALEPFNPDETKELPFGERGTSLKMPFDFLVSADDPPEHVDIAGRFEIKTAAGTEAIEFTHLPDAEGVSRRRGGVTVSLDEVSIRPAEDQRQTARIQVAVVYDTGGPAFESHRTWIFHNEVFLETEDGRRFGPKGGFQTRLQADGAVVVEYRFPNVTGDPANWKFVYMAPTLIVNVPVEVKFHDVQIQGP